MMFMQIGLNQIIKTADIIAMINQQDIETSEINEEMLQDYDYLADELTYDEDCVKTIIFTTEGTYSSPLSIQTLKKRTHLKALLEKG